MRSFSALLIERCTTVLTTFGSYIPFHQLMPSYILRLLPEANFGIFFLPRPKEKKRLSGVCPSVQLLLCCCIGISKRSINIEMQMAN
jgi:hypothetical protein